MISTPTRAIGRRGMDVLAISQTWAVVVTLAAIALALSPMPEGGAAPSKPRPLSFSITATTGEHSRDSNSTTTSITLNGNQIHYGRSYAGYRASRRSAIDKSVQIHNEDLDRIQKLLVENDLLRSRSSISPSNQPGSYVEIDATITSAKGRSVLKFSAMRESAEKDNLYVGLQALLSEIEQIVNP